jgi:hypothetical protein
MWRDCMKNYSNLLFVCLLIFLFAACSSSSTDSTGAASRTETGNDTLISVDPVEETSAEPPIFEPNPNAKADAFRLYYKERTDRLLTSINRYAMTGDAIGAAIINKMFIAKDGDDYEVIAGPVDNNAHGYTTFATWKLYQAMGGRNLELTLIRMFEGLAFYEAVTGHEGLTVREALPGWTRTMDGRTDSITRTKNGDVVATPVPFPNAPALEKEIMDTFFSGVKISYRENPEEFFYSFKPINEVEDYAVTYVFDHVGEPLEWIPVSNCCSSFMKAQMGPWKGLGWWGNHNSRDNFTDYVMGYLAAFEAEKTPGLPEDLAIAAKHAADAARNVGNTTTRFGNILMTVDERADYYTLAPAGEVRPDGRTEWQDLGSISSCQMAYLAKALSKEGLHSPVPKVPLPGDLPHEAVESLFKSVGIPVTLRVKKCKCLDEAWFGLTFGDLLGFKILGEPWYEKMERLTYYYPDLFYNLIGSAMDDFQELILGSVGLVYYAKITGDTALYDEAYESLGNLIRIQVILAKLVYGVDRDSTLKASVIKKLGSAYYNAKQDNAKEMLYKGALYERMFGFDSPLRDLDGFAPAEAQISWAASPLSWGDTVPQALMSDDKIKERIMNEINRKKEKEPWIYDRYVSRFFDAAGNHNPPIRRTADGYEFLDQNNQWRSAENPHHNYFGGLHYWLEAPLAVWSKQTLDCEWARLGCKPADFDDSGRVDSTDTAIFNGIWDSFGGAGAICTAGCGGADLDRDGRLDKDDQDYMQAAQGCTR